MPKAERKRRSRSQERRIRLHFLGATKMVTGSLHFFEISDGDKRIVRFFLDAGLNQENHSQNFQNRLPAGIKPEDVDFGIFSHAHIDHTGFFPKLVKDGFKGVVYTTAATRELVSLLLPDSGHLQEEEADRINARNAKRAASAKDGGKGGRPSQQSALKTVRKVEPLYTEQEAIQSLFRIKTVEFDQPFQVMEGIVLRFTPASHLLGAAVVTLELGTGSKKRRIVFTGDLGRPNMAILQEVAPIALADYVICEGTYGNKLHAQRDRLAALAEKVNAALDRAKNGGAKRGAKNGAGVILMAAFAIGRVQALLYDLRQLIADGRIPNIPVFVDGRMANNATEIHRNNSALYNKTAAKVAASGTDLFSPPRYQEIREWQDSVLLDNPGKEPVIIISSSGMAAGGRIIRHLENRLPHEQNTVLFCGFQSTGTLGRQLVTPGVESVRINGKDVAVRATIEHMQDYSGHADYEDIIRWLKGFQTKPAKLFLVHGEDDALEAMKLRIEERLRWTVEIPKLRDYIDID